MILLAVDFENLHQILRNLYMEMMPLCSNMTEIAKGIAGLGALFYVASRVWQALSRAEPIDVYPMLRPFAVGLCILFFPTFGSGDNEYGAVASGKRNTPDARITDLRHEPVPAAKRPARI